MCKSQNLFYSYDFRARGAGRATATSFAAHHILESTLSARDARISWGCPTARCHEVCIQLCRVCPRSLHCPPKPPRPTRCCMDTCAGDLLVQPQLCPNPAPNAMRQSHWYWYLREAHKETVSPHHSPLFGWQGFIFWWAYADHCWSIELSITCCMHLQDPCRVTQLFMSPLWSLTTQDLSTSSSSSSHGAAAANFKLYLGKTPSLLTCRTAT